MASSTTILDLLTTSQASRDIYANALFDPASPAMLFGRRAATTTGTTWGYYGGQLIVDGVLTSIGNGTVALSSTATNYVEATRAGSVSSNTSAFTAGRIPLYTVVTSGGLVTSYTDNRAWVQPASVSGRLALSLASDANVTLTAAQARCQILDITSSVSLTATRNIVLPLSAQQWIVANLTTGAQSLQFISATGTGITVANGKRAIVYADGTNIVRATADV